MSAVVRLVVVLGAVCMLLAGCAGVTSETSQSTGSSGFYDPFASRQPSAAGDSGSESATTVEICERIAQQYYYSHQYIGDDVFDCDSMSADVWNMLVAREINAKIGIGNVQRATSDIRDFDHAWVIAETSPGSWLAIETTGGFVVTGADNPLYYHGIFFDSPRGLRQFYTLWDQYNAQIARCETAAGRYQAACEVYADASDSGKTALLPSINQAAGYLEAELARLQELVDEIEGLISQL